MSEGQKGGEFFTPTAIVQLIVGIIEPFHGRIFDPACGSGGMFAQSARFVAEHKPKGTLTRISPSGRDGKGRGGHDCDGTISVYGQEKVAETVRLGKMNLFFTIEPAQENIRGTEDRATVPGEKR